MTQLTWLVTGCSSGLGEFLVQHVIARGDIAIATCRGDVSRMKHLADAGAKIYSLDVTASQMDINATAARMIEDNGNVDVLVNNAGYIEAGMAEEMSYENYVAQFETNFFGLIKVTQALLPHFRARKSGTIVHMGSMGGISGEASGGAYCATKFALEGWHDSVRPEVAHLNIRCLLVEPGFFRTRVFAPSNIKFRGNHIADYAPIREAVEQFAQQIDGTERGDPNKCAQVIVDVVKGEGGAKGKELPERLPIGPDAVERMRKRCTDVLSICDEWKGVVSRTDFDA